MNQKEYAQHLLNLIDDDRDVETQQDLDDLFFAYFQCFMPNGIGVEKVFEPLIDGELYYQRLMQIYEPTKERFEKLADENCVPAYFCPEKTANNQEIQEHAEKYLDNLKQLAKKFADDEFFDTLQNIQTVKIIENYEYALLESDTNDIVYESISEIFCDLDDDSLTIAILSEAYYSIACDYKISYYLQYPKYEQYLGFDVFEPYFQLWKHGYKCYFDESIMIVST